MPADDLIFQRLKAATPAELATIAKLLDEELIGEPAADIAALSRGLRKTAGHSLRNPWRGDHELRYEQIMEDVLAESASSAGWARPKLKRITNALWVEDYAALALAFAAQKRGATEEQSAQARAVAEAALNGTYSVQEPWKGSALTAAVVVGLGVLGGAIALSLYSLNRFVLSGSMSKVVPAVLVLIQIRLRQAAEQSLEATDARA